MKFFFLLILFVTAQPQLQLSASVSIPLSLEPLYDADCPICMEPLLENYPNFFECGHDNFHAKCILLSFQGGISPIVISCPLCRAPIVPTNNYIHHSTVEALLILPSSIASSNPIFNDRIINTPKELRGKRTTRNLESESIGLQDISTEEFQVLLHDLVFKRYSLFENKIREKSMSDIQYVELVRIVIRNYKNAGKYLKLLRVRDWGIIQPIFNQYIANSDSFTMMIDLIQLGPMSQDHIR